MRCKNDTQRIASPSLERGLQLFGGNEYLARKWLAARRALGNRKPQVDIGLHAPGLTATFARTFPSRVW